VKFTLPTGEQLLVPRRAAELLIELLEALGDGHDPSVLPVAMELSTGEVAALLGVSRQYVARLLDEGRIPSRRVGAHRRVLASDVLRYRRDDDRRRVRRLRQMAG
jgi:excisionase family DNA binding protein